MITECIFIENCTCASNSDMVLKGRNRLSTSIFKPEGQFQMLLTGNTFLTAVFVELQTKKIGILF